MNHILDSNIDEWNDRLKKEREEAERRRLRRRKLLIIVLALALLSAAVVAVGSLDGGEEVVPVPPPSPSPTATPETPRRELTTEDKEFARSVFHHLISYIRDREFRSAEELIMSHDAARSLGCRWFSVFQSAYRDDPRAKIEFGLLDHRLREIDPAGTASWDLILSTERKGIPDVVHRAIKTEDGWDVRHEFVPTVIRATLAIYCQGG